MHAPQPPRREPVLTIPGAMLALIVVLCLIHGVRAMLPPEIDEDIIWMFGFVPARYDASVMAGEFPGGFAASIWSFLTYSLLHADITHIAFNLLWMLPFGSAVARRFGPARFFLFLAVSAVAGALAHLATHQHEIAPMIGASAAVSGVMAAAIRFAFQSGSFLSLGNGGAESAARVPALPLWQALRNGRVLAFLGVWFGFNLLTGLGAIAIGGTQVQSIAWQAHIGGFAAGLLLFSLFDPIPQVDLRGGEAAAVPADDADRP